MAREMKDSGVEWIGEIPREWEVRKYKYFCENRMGETILATEVKEIGIPIYSATLEDSIFGYIENPKLILKKNDFVIPARGNSIGSVTIIKDEIATCTQTTICSRNIKNININYLYFSSIGLKDIWFKYEGSAIPQITVNQIENNIVVYPPLEEQEKIANYLDRKVSDIDLIIEKTKATIEDYKKYKQSIITEAVTKGINPNVEMKDSGIEWIGEIPREWEVTKLKNIAYMVTDGAHVSPETENGIYDFVSTVNLKNDKIDFDNCLKTSEKSYNQLVLNNCNPKKNDILISKDGTVGRTVVVDFDREFVVASSLVIIRVNTKIINPYFLNYNLKSKYIQEYLILLMTGAGLKRVSVEKNANLLILFPPLEEQNQIAEYLDKKTTEIDTLITKKEALIAELEEYKKSLIYECVTGKKEIK